ncbi:5439_t:CDS:2 [Gigaspora margarita]|uniref:5439_t:CDS:1 n=1 Tax=Gigaspora margarita TaxID=4874 RepID=A0ABN7VD20_GIGMA|nr:5439_t:CDS:2 [Gigaspora margarita]
MEEMYGVSTVSQAEEFMKDFSNPSNLIKFKQLVEDSEIKLPERILIQALELLSDASSFKYHSENTILYLEIQLRTWMATLERVCYSSIILGCEIREQLYKNLSNFVNIHYKAKTVFKQGVIHLRDTLHSMRDDETRTDETLRRIRDFLLALIHISPKAASTTSGNILGVAESLPNFAKALNFKYPITYWYPTWRELLSIHYSLENLTKDDIYSTLRFYNETYLLELLWQYVFNLSINQIASKEILNSQNEVLEFLNLWTKKEPTAPPNSLWFGALDLAQSLSQKTSQLVSLALCYYLGLESLQKSKCNYICFKSLELLLTLSYKKPELFGNIIQDEINKYKESLLTPYQQVFEELIHDVTQKLQLNNQFMEQLSFKSIKEKSEIKGDRKLIFDIIADELTCPVTRQITGDFLILSCGHSISSDAINKWKEVTIIENRLFECPICKNEIKLNSSYNFPKNEILKSLYEKLKKQQQIPSNKIHMVEDDLFLKFNKYKIFQNPMSMKFSTQIFQKVQPKLILPAFNKAAKAEQQEDYETVIMWLTQVIQLYPKSYSIRCRRAFASYKLKMYSKAKDDLDTAIQLKPSKHLAYLYRNKVVKSILETGGPIALIACEIPTPDFIC